MHFAENAITLGIMMFSPRQTAILRMIHKCGSLSIAKLTEAFPVSRETLRKDLVFLESNGYIGRKYGLVDFLDGEPGKQWLSIERRLSASQRRDRILELVQGHKNVRISALAVRLKVSGITVRSDLLQLERSGLVVRKHGSVSPLAGAEDRSETASFNSFRAQGTHPGRACPPAHQPRRYNLPRRRGNRPLHSHFLAFRCQYHRRVGRPRYFVPASQAAIRFPDPRSSRQASVRLADHRRGARAGCLRQTDHRQSLPHDLLPITRTGRTTWKARRP